MRTVGFSRNNWLAVARLDGGLPSFMGLARGPGAWSRQTAPAVDGTTFLELGTAQNTPRFDYDPVSGRTMLLIEPTRTNIIPNPNFVDVAPNNNVPDGWTTAFGAAGVNFQCVGAGPHGGTVYRIIDSSGHFQLVAVPGASGIACSVWVRRVTATGAFSILSVDVPPGSPTIALGAAAHDWQRYISQETTVGAGAAIYFLYRQAGSDDVRLVLPQAEVGDCASSFTAATRAAELLTIDPDVVGRLSGCVGGLVRFDFPSTAALTLDPVIHCWANGYKLVYDPADDKVKVVVAGTKRAESAALTFSRQGLLRWRVRYGASGQELTVVGGGVSAKYTDPTAWGDPGVLAPYLGSDAASANCRPMAHGDYLSAAA